MIFLIHEPQKCLVQRQLARLLLFYIRRISHLQKRRSSAAERNLNSPAYSWHSVQQWAKESKIKLRLYVFYYEIGFVGHNNMIAHFLPQTPSFIGRQQINTSNTCVWPVLRFVVDLLFRNSRLSTKCHTALGLCWWRTSWRILCFCGSLPGLPGLIQ